MPNLSWKRPEPRLLIRAIVLIYLALVPTLVLAQPLDRFLEAADQTNLDVQLAAANAARTSAESGQVWGGLLPAVTVAGAFVRNQVETSIDVPTGPTTSDTITIAKLNQLDLSVRVEVPLIDVNRWLQTAGALASERAAGLRAAATRTQVRREVVVAYYAAAAAQALLATGAESLVVAQAQLRQQQARGEAGVATELERVRAEAEVQRTEQVLTDARALDANARRTLFSLTGLMAEAFPSLAPDDLQAEPPISELEGNLSSLSAVRATEEDASGARRTAAAAVAALFPRVDAQFTQRFTNATGFAGQGALWNAGVNLSWRLDAPGVQGLRAANARADIAALTAAKARLAAADQLHADWVRTSAAASKLKAAQSQVVSSRRAAALAGERQGAGVGTQLELISADRDHLQAQVNAILARYELASARATLQLGANRDLEATR